MSLFAFVEKNFFFIIRFEMDKKLPNWNQEWNAMNKEFNIKVKSNMFWDYSS